MRSQVRQWIASLTCTLSVAMTGSCFVWMAPLMVMITLPNSPVPMTTSDSSWLSSVIEIGAAVFTIPVGLLADIFGRKTMMMSTGPLCLLGWILIATTRSIYVLYFVRIIQGISVAICFTVAPMYIAEVAEPRIRGKLSGQFQALWYVGCLYAYSTGPFLSYNNYAYVCAIPTVIFIVLFSLVPESPYFLLMVKKEEKARKALLWLRGDGDITMEFQNIKKSLDDEMECKGRWKELFATSKDRNGFLIVQLVCLIKYLGGMCAVVMYVTQTFEEEFGKNLKSHEMTIILATILVVTTFSSSLITDRIGRKPLLVISSAGSAFFSLLIAIIYYLDNNTSINVTSIKWISFASLICFCVISNIGLGPLMQTIQAEYFPSRTRGIGGGITEVVASLGSFVNIKQYQMINDYFGVYMNYVIFFIVSFLGTILFSIFIVETAGKSLSEIQETFEENNKKNKS